MWLTLVAVTKNQYQQVLVLILDYIKSFTICKVYSELQPRRIIIFDGSRNNNLLELHS